MGLLLAINTLMGFSGINLLENSLSTTGGASDAMITAQGEIITLSRLSGKNINASQAKQQIDKSRALADQSLDQLRTAGFMSEPICRCALITRLKPSN